jgi:hypothetical protein
MKIRMKMNGKALALVLTFTLITCLFGSTVLFAAGDTSQQLSIPMKSAPDDMEERSDGSLDYNSTDLEICKESSSRNQLIGLRFAGVNIPKGATITSAYIQFSVDEPSKSVDPFDVKIFAEDKANAAPYENVNFAVSSRTRTGAYVNWSNIPLWAVEHEAGAAQKTPNIAALLQKIVEKEGWAAGNAINFILSGTGTRTAESFEGAGSNLAQVPTLHLQYTTESATTTTPITPTTTPTTTTTTPTSTATTTIAPVTATTPTTPITSTGTSTPSASVAKYGLTGDGVTNNNSAFAALLAATPSGSNLTLEAGKNYVVTQPIVLTKPITLNLNGSTITCKKTTDVFKSEASNITIKNGVLDLNYTTHNGINVRESNQLLFENLVIKNLLPTAANNEGGIRLNKCTNITINGCTFKNIYNYNDPGSIDHSPSVLLVSCKYITVNKMTADNCGIGIDLYGAENVEVNDFNFSKINNNGFYIQTSSKNINIQNGKINGAGSGVVFHINNYTTAVVAPTVSCKNVEFSNISNKAVQLRDGSGILISHCTFTNNSYGVAQSSDYSGCSNIIVEYNTINTPYNIAPFSFIKDSIINMHDNIFNGSFAAYKYAIKIDDSCSKYTIKDNYISVDGVVLSSAIPIKMDA